MAEKPILLDLACGTGSLSVELSRLGYDVIGVDGSADMLSEAASKGAGEILWLCQDFSSLDLYGHGGRGGLRARQPQPHHRRDGARGRDRRVALFTAPGGVFVFDVNTPYKHREILGQNTFVYDLGDLYCVWQNATDDTLLTEITLDFFVREKTLYAREGESFCERGYSHDTLAGILDRAGFELLAVYAGDTFDPVGETTQRAVYAARRRG